MSEPESRRSKREEELEREIQRLQEENERLRQQNERLRQQLEKVLRAAKRQAAPHSRGEPKQNPPAPGRKPGAAYGRQACRPVPRQVHEAIDVPLPKRCSHCGGPVEFQRTAQQFQEEIVRSTLVRRFDIAIGQCRDCQRHVQGRHELQTSDAVGAAAVQLGPEALTLAALMNKQMGLSLGHTTQVLQQGFGLQVSRAGICRALARLAARAGPSYPGLIVAARQSLVNHLDETGWRVGARLHWLHVAVAEQVTVYAILPGRGFEQLAYIVGAQYEGFLWCDGTFHPAAALNPLVGYTGRPLLRRSFRDNCCLGASHRPGANDVRERRPSGHSRLHAPVDCRGRKGGHLVEGHDMGDQPPNQELAPQ